MYTNKTRNSESRPSRAPITCVETETSSVFTQEKQRETITSLLLDRKLHKVISELTMYVVD